MSEDSNVFSNLARGAGWTAAGIAISKVLSYFYRAAIARFVGPEAYGTLSLGIMAVSIASTISLFALHNAITNFVPKYRERGDEGSIRGTVLSSFEISVPLAVTSGVLMFVFAEEIALGIFDSAGLIPVLKIFAFVPPFRVIGTHSLLTTKAFQKAKYDVFTRRIFQNAVQLVGSLALIGLSYGVVGAAVGWLIGSVLAAILGIYFMEKKVGPILLGNAEPKRDYSKILKYSYPLVLSGAIGTILGWTDTAFIGYYMNETSVGLYNAALPTSALMMMPYTAFAALAMPSMSEILERDDKNLSNVLKTLTRWTFMVSFPMFVLMALFSDQVLHILFGQEYRTAALSLTVLSFGYMFSTGVGHLDTVIKTLGHTKMLFHNSVLNFVLNIILNVMLIPQYGILGGAIATTGSMIFVNLLLLGEVYHVQGIHPFSLDSLKPVVSAVPALLVVYSGLEYFFDIVPLWALIPGGLVFGGIYLSCLYLAGGLKQEELSVLSSFIEYIRPYKEP